MTQEAKKALQSALKNIPGVSEVEILDTETAIRCSFTFSGTWHSMNEVMGTLKSTARLVGLPPTSKQVIKDARISILFEKNKNENLGSEHTTKGHRAYA